MSILTKVFIVLLVFFSIAFTVMTVSIVAQTTNWRDTALKYQQHAQIADTNLRNQIVVCSAELATARDEINGHMERVGQIQVQLQTSENNLARMRGELARVQSEKTGAEAMNRALVAQLQAAEGARAQYQEQRNGLEKKNIDLQQRNIDLNDRVNELTARIAVVLEEKRHYEQQINILKEENAKLSQAIRRPSLGLALEAPSGEALSGVEALTPVSASAIRGHVLEISGDLVTVSVGGADGVKKGMVFVIHRDDAYVGDLRISLVEPNESAGRLGRSTAAPIRGDQVIDATSLAASGGR